MKNNDRERDEAYLERTTKNSEVKELIELIKPLISKNGVLVNGIGILTNKMDKQIEILDKIQKFQFFQEKRQKEMQEENMEIISLLRAIAAKIK